MLLVTFCVVCSLSVIGGQFALSFGTPTLAGPLTFDPNCKDKLDNCYDFPEENCRSPYEQWAEDFCGNRCGYCNGPTTPAPSCENKLPNCEAYGKEVCSKPDYTAWANENCRYFCRACTQSQLDVLDSLITTIPPSKCVDKVDCRQYGASACSDAFKEWSKDNCPNHCGYCPGLSTTPTPCVDKIPNCKAYDASTCSDPDYKLWAEDNCRKTCGVCVGAPTLAPAAPTPPVPHINSGAATAPPVCVDKLLNCKDYGASTCTDPTYKVWIEANCRKTCGVCVGAPTLAPAAATPPVPHINSGVPTPAPPHSVFRIPGRRQFEASHHHHGVAQTEAPAERSTASSIMDSSFPGDEYKPHPKPDENWDSKPSTETPVSTEKTKPPVQTTTSLPLTNDTQPTGVVTEVTVNPSTGMPIDISTPEMTSVTDAPVTETPLTTTTTAPVSIVTDGGTGTTTTTAPPGQSTEEPVVSNGQTDVTTAKTGSSPSNAPTGTMSPASNASIAPSETATPSEAATSTIITEAPTGTTTEASTSSTQASTTPTNIALTTVKPCRDTLETCSLYGKPMCTQEAYGPWAHSHCQLFCGFCTPAEFKCEDKRANCKEFDSGDLCTAASYLAWARENCMAYCGFHPCEKSTTQVEVTTTVGTTSIEAVTTKHDHANNKADDDCVDVLPNCVYYNDEKCVGDYEPWARAHCKRRCGYCGAIECTDKLKYCDAYPAEVCTADSYRGWARDNCRKFCNLCAAPTPGSMVSQQTGSPQTPDVPISSAPPVLASTTHRHG